MRPVHTLRALVLLVVGVALSGCGSSPTSPSAGTGVRVHGIALGSSAGSAATHDVRTMSERPSGITVSVQNTAITAKVSVSGTFELEDLPAGTFTLVFSQNGTVIGTVTITSVPTAAEVNVVVQITTTTVIVVKIEVNGTDTTETETDNQSPGDSTPKTCAIDGGRVGDRIELEGSISSAAGATFQMAVNGQRSGSAVTVDAAGASFQCAGVKAASCDASLIKGGAKVHVSGTLTACTTTSAQVTANSVKFQNGN